LLGNKERVSWSRDTEALTLEPPQKQPCEHAVVFKLSLGSD